MAISTSQFIQQTYQQPYRITGKVSASRNIYPDYDKFVWSLAQKFTNSAEEADAAAGEMFTDIRRYAERGVSVKSIENRLIARVAFRRLIKFLQ